MISPSSYQASTVDCCANIGFPLAGFCQQMSRLVGGFATAVRLYVQRYLNRDAGLLTIKFPYSYLLIPMDKMKGVAHSMPGPYRNNSIVKDIFFITQRANEHVGHLMVSEYCYNKKLSKTTFRLVTFYQYFFIGSEYLRIPIYRIFR